MERQREVLPKDRSEGEHWLDVWGRNGAYNDLKAIARRRGLPLRKALEELIREAETPELDVTG